MTEPPTREEILAAFKTVLDRFEGSVSIEHDLPNKIECQRDGIWIQFLGRLKGWCVFAKRNAAGFAIAICLYGDFRQGINTIVSDGKIAFNSVSRVIEYGAKHLELPATEFAVFDRPQNWPLPPSEAIEIVVTTRPPMTTTTAPPTSTTTTTMPPGSGMVPRSPDWRYYS